MSTIGEAADAEMKRTEWLFFILVPVCMLVVSFFYDIGLNIFQEKRVENVTKAVVTEALTTNVVDYHDRVRMLYEKNKVTVDHLEVKYEEGILTIYNIHVYPSFFFRLFGVDHYRVETSIKAYLVGDEQVKIEKVNPDAL